MYKNKVIIITCKIHDENRDSRQKRLGELNKLIIYNMLFWELAFTYRKAYRAHTSWSALKTGLLLNLASIFQIQRTSIFLISMNIITSNFQRRSCCFYVFVSLLGRIALGGLKGRRGSFPRWLLTCLYLWNCAKMMETAVENLHEECSWNLSLRILK